MSFQPPDPSQRPRSTPIPDPDHRGHEVRPPTPAEFLRAQDAPPAPPPGAHLADGPDAALPPGRTGCAPLVATAVIVALAIGGVALAVFYNHRQSRRDAVRVEISFPDFSIPDFSIPDLPGPVTTVGGPGAPGAANLFEPGASRAMTAALEQQTPGDPTRFTQIIIFPSYAVAFAVDPQQPGRSAMYLLQGGTVSALPGSVPVPAGTQPFMVADVDWDAVPTLVAQAPGLLGASPASVTHVIVEHSPFRDGAPLTIRVYAAGGDHPFVDATAAGKVLPGP